MKILRIKEVQVILTKELNLEIWSTVSELQEHLKCGEILEIKLVNSYYDDSMSYVYHVKYIEF